MGKENNGRNAQPVKHRKVAGKGCRLESSLLENERQVEGSGRKTRWKRTVAG